MQGLVDYSSSDDDADASGGSSPAAASAPPPRPAPPCLPRAADLLAGLGVPPAPPTSTHATIKRPAVEVAGGREAKVARGGSGGMPPKTTTTRARVAGGALVPPQLRGR